MAMTEARSNGTTGLAEVRPPPRVPGMPLLGHLLAFRADRAGVQLRTARSYPDAARMRMGTSICSS